jgi:hypothetical protein
MSIVLLGSTSGSCTLQEQAVAGTSVLTLPVGTGTVVANNVNSAIVSGTAVASTSGTNIDFTGLPSWVKRITVMFRSMSVSGTSGTLMQLGTSGGIVSSGYASTGIRVTNANSTGGLSSTAGFILGPNAAADSISGTMQICLIDTNTWVANYTGKYATTAAFYGGGDIALGGTLDRIRITTVNGTDTFDAGTINILYE